LSLIIRFYFTVVRPFFGPERSAHKCFDLTPLTTGFKQNILPYKRSYNPLILTSNSGLLTNGELLNFKPLKTIKFLAKLTQNLSKNGYTN
jgi:hypothetical protein